jgi:hypothetical protein
VAEIQSKICLRVRIYLLKLSTCSRSLITALLPSLLMASAAVGYLVEGLLLHLKSTLNLVHCLGFRDDDDDYDEVLVSCTDAPVCSSARVSNTSSAWQYILMKFALQESECLRGNKSWPSEI